MAYRAWMRRTLRVEKRAGSNMKSLGVGLRPPDDSEGNVRDRDVEGTTD